MIQPTLTLKMTTAQVVEASVTVNNNSPIQDYVHPDDQTQPTFIMSIISVKGMFLKTPSHDLRRSCLWVVARRDHQHPSCLNWKTYTTFLDLYCKLRKLFFSARIYGPRAISSIFLELWSDDSHYIVPNTFKISFSVPYSKFLSSMKTFSSWKIDNRKKIVLKIFNRVYLAVFFKRCSLRTQTSPLSTPRVTFQVERSDDWKYVAFVVCKFHAKFIGNRLPFY